MTKLQALAAQRAAFLRLDEEYYAEVTAGRTTASGSTALAALVWGSQLVRVCVPTALPLLSLSVVQRQCTSARCMAPIASCSCLLWRKHCHRDMTAAPCAAHMLVLERIRR